MFNLRNHKYQNSRKIGLISNIEESEDIDILFSKGLKAS